MEALGVAIVVFLFVCLYFLPLIVAGLRHHRSCGGIFVINFFLGWTFIGWVIALAWAANSNVEPKSDVKSL